MRIPLALCNVLQEKLRTLVGTMGVAFALVLVFMQLGFLGSVVNSATLILDQLDCEIIIVSNAYQHIGESGAFPRLRLAETRSILGVDRATPLYIGFQAWRSERDKPEEDLPIVHRGRNRTILMLGFPPSEQPFRLDDHFLQSLPFGIKINRADITGLKRLDTMLVDEQSHRSFEPRHPGQTAEIGGRKIRIAGQFSLGSSFASDGTMLVGDQTFSSLLGGYPLDQVSLGLVKLKSTHRNRSAEVAGRIREILVRQGPPGHDSLGRRDVQVFTRDGLRKQEVRYWVEQKSIGFIFKFGVIIAFIIGLVVVYQVLSSDIVDHFGEYATLKAMGYSNLYLASVVIQQALILSLLGFVPAFLASLGLYQLTRSTVQLPINMTLFRAVSVLVMAIVMCSGAALLSVRKVTSSDPANLF
jgi:putative ABC transport system permease protein